MYTEEQPPTSIRILHSTVQCEGSRMYSWDILDGAAGDLEVKFLKRSFLPAMANYTLLEKK
jgi:hypothetical protein